MTEEQSKKDFYRLLTYMEKKKVSEHIQDTVFGLISIIRPKQKAYQALKEIVEFTSLAPDEKQIFHQINKIYKKYRNN